MPKHSLFIALLLSSAALPLACNGESTTNDGAGGTSGKAGASGKSGGSGKAGATTSPGGTSSGRAGSAGVDFGTGGRAGSGFGRAGTGGAFGGMGGSSVPSGGSGDTTSTGGQADDGEDLGVAERRPYCRTVCAYGPSASSRVISADAGAAGAASEAGGAPGSGGEAQGGVPGSAGEGGAPASTPCGHVDGCVASLCPTQRSAQCGELLTVFVECMANADAEVVASLVRSCTETQGPSLDTLIYQACYGQYADWTRGCL